MARVLLDSARLHHPEAELFLCLADSIVNEPGLYPDDCTIVSSENLNIPDFPCFAFRYDVMAFNRAIKPFLIKRIASLGFDAVLYFDADIQIFRPLTDVFAALSAGASFVLTPHISRPAEGSAYRDDLNILRIGTYNVGFVGVSSGAEAHRLLEWWSRHTEYECRDDPASGLFFDQRFMDLMPAFSTTATILRDQTLNVAYWNLSQRNLTLSDEENWLVDGRPLGFFHFSGFSPDAPSRLSKHTAGFSGPDLPSPLLRIMTQYAERLRDNGYGAVPVGAYAYRRFESGAAIPDLVRELFCVDHQKWVGNPFENFEDYLGLPLIQPWDGPEGAFITRILGHLHAKQEELSNLLDPKDNLAAGNYLRWLVEKGDELAIDARLWEPALSRYGNSSPPLRLPPQKYDPLAPDVDVVGYLELALGVGEAGRLALKALTRTGLTVKGIETSLSSPASKVDTSCQSLLVDEGKAPIQLFVINADQIKSVVEHLRGRIRSDAYRIITPFWELAHLPDSWLSAYEIVDEVWAPTRFIQRALLEKVQKPVIHIPMLLDFDPPPSLPRSRFGLPRDRFLFFFAFDYLSFIERKNPVGAFEAFKSAFRRFGETYKTGLVIKTQHADKLPAKAQPLRAMLEDDPDVILIDQTLSREETLGLIGACDAVLSLHRSEGLGLLVAEAMVLGKPVISTDYSGTTELVTSRTGYPVDYTLVPVEEGDYPFAAGQVWAEADIDHAAWQMRRVFLDEDVVAKRVSEARLHIKMSFGAAEVTNRQLDRLRKLGLPPDIDHR